MKILVVSHGFPPRGIWGTEFYTHALVHGLVRRGHELAVLHPVREGVRPRYEIQEVREDGVPIHLLHNATGRERAFAPSYRDAGVEAAFEGLLERVRPDLVHFTYLLWGLSVRLPVLARERRIPTVLTLTDYGLLCHRGQMFDHRLERCGGPHPAATCARCIRTPGPHDHGPLVRLAKEAAAAVLAAVGGAGQVVVTRDLQEREAAVRAALDAVSRFVAPTRRMAEVFTAAGVPADRIEELVYAFDDTAYRAAPARPADPPRFGFLAQFAPHKGLGTLLEAARLLDLRDPARPWELVLHGGAPGGRHRLYASRVLGGHDPRRVRVAGPFDPDAAPEVFARLSALCLPSEWDENAPLSVLQARAAGIPVLGTDVPGIAEVADPAGLVAVGDAAALADRMEDVLAGRIVGGRPRGLPLSLDEHLDRIEALYSQIPSTPG